MLCRAASAGSPERLCRSTQRGARLARRKQAPHPQLGIPTALCLEGTDHPSEDTALEHPQWDQLTAR